MKIVAIGGGEIGRPGTRVETLKIDKEMIALSGKRRPKLLFLPTASHDSQGYVRVVETYFGTKLGCEVDTLLLWANRLSLVEIRKKIRSADILYVGGGNTLSMLKRWRKLGVDTFLREAATNGTVLAGVSAGAVCWFRFANSDSRKLADPSADYIRIRGLNVIPLFLVPHFDTEQGRQTSLKKMLKGTRQTAIGLDDCAALAVSGDTCRVITSRANASAYLCYWRGDKYIKEMLPTGKIFSLSDLSSIPATPSRE